MIPLQDSVYPRFNRFFHSLRQLHAVSSFDLGTWFWLEHAFGGVEYPNKERRESLYKNQDARHARNIAPSGSCLAPATTIETYDWIGHGLETMAARKRKRFPNRQIVIMANFRIGRGG